MASQVNKEKCHICYKKIKNDIQVHLLSCEGGAEARNMIEANKKAVKAEREARRKAAHKLLQKEKAREQEKANTRAKIEKFKTGEGEASKAMVERDVHVEKEPPTDEGTVANEDTVAVDAGDKETVGDEETGREN